MLIVLQVSGQLFKVSIILFITLGQIYYSSSAITRFCLTLASSLALAGFTSTVALLALAGVGTLASLAVAGSTGAGLVFTSTVGAGLGAGTVGRAGHCGVVGDGVGDTETREEERIYIVRRGIRHVGS